jgi:hypothetical protein
VVDKTNTPDKIRDIVNEVYANVKPEANPFDLDAPQSINEFITYGPAIISACDKLTYGATWKEETRLNKVLSQGGSYFSLLAEAEANEQFVITQTQEDKLDSCLAGLNRDKVGQGMIYMVSEEYTNGKPNGVEYLNEQEVVWQEDGLSFPLKGKIDRLRIDHNTGEFTVIDLKTTGKQLAEFPKSFEQYHYARQMAAYEIAAAKFLVTTIVLVSSSSSARR